jgi:hypothetical protein
MAARTLLEPEGPLSVYPVSAGWLTFTASDATNGNAVKMNGRYIVYAKNTGDTNNTIMIRTSADSNGRFDDALITIVPNATAIFSGIANAGFIQKTDGCFWIDTSSSDVELAVWKMDR